MPGFPRFPRARPRVGQSKSLGHGVERARGLCRRRRRLYKQRIFIAALCALIAVPCSGVWLVFGASLSRLLKDPRVTRPFNWTMAALLVASIAPTLFE
jgi:hypothetical protein